MNRKIYKTTNKTYYYHQKPKCYFTNFREKSIQLIEQEKEKLVNDGSLSRGNLDGLVLELFLDAYHGSPKAVKKMTGFVNIQENDLENNLQYRVNYSSFTISLDIQQIFHSEGTELAA